MKSLWNEDIYYIKCNNTWTEGLFFEPYQISILLSAINTFIKRINLIL